MKTLRLSDEWETKLKEMAMTDGVTESHVLRAALEAHYERFAAKSARQRLAPYIVAASTSHAPPHKHAKVFGARDMKKAFGQIMDEKAVASKARRKTVQATRRKAA